MAYDRQASKECYRAYLSDLAARSCMGVDSEKVWKEFDDIAEVLQLVWDAQTLLRQKGYGHSGLNILKTVELVPAR